MEEYESEEKALLAACNLLGLSLEEVKQIKPKIVHYFFPEDATLEVYKVDENLSFGIGFTRHHRGQNFYGLWLIEEEKVERI
ncbi:MAG: hypothetical protein QXS48_02985 [Candidatus Aenigmatarchaeota archaeon]